MIQLNRRKSILPHFGNENVGIILETQPLFFHFVEQSKLKVFYHTLKHIDVVLILEKKLSFEHYGTNEMQKNFLSICLENFWNYMPVKVLGNGNIVHGGTSAIFKNSYAKSQAQN